jgi:hypothetical protein
MLTVMGFSLLASSGLVCYTIRTMKKTDAIQIFGTASALSKAIGVTRSAVSQWPDHLDQSQADRVLGAAYRLGLVEKLPESVIRNSGKAA